MFSSSLRPLTRYRSSRKALSTSQDPLLFMWGTDSSGSLLKPSDRQTETKIDIPQQIDYSSLFNGKQIASVTCGATDTAFLTTNGDCYVSGINKYGQLGLGHNNAVTTPTLLETIQIKENENGTAKQAPIKQVSLGSQTGAYVDSDGDLYTCGHAGSALTIGALGHGLEATGNVLVPTLITSLIEDGCSVKKVVCSEQHTTVLTTEGEVLTTGHGSYGRLGNFDTVDQLYFEPVELLSSNSGVIDIVAGKSFTLALTKDGVLYGWGRNQQGQLGTGYGLAVDMYAMQALPEPIESDELVGRQISQCSAGYAHAVCVTNEGSNIGGFFEWGMSMYLEPTRVQEFINKNIVQVACGQNYTLALDSEGYVYSWGQKSSGKTGVLGHGTTIVQTTQPVLVETLQDYRVTQLSAGWKHVACLATKR